MSKKSRRNSVRSHFLQTFRKFYSDGWDLREHLQRRARQFILGEKSIQRKVFLNEYKMEIQNSERWNSEYESQRELESQRRQMLKANQWADQAQREREYICVADWGWRTIFMKKAMQEVAEKIEELKRSGCQEKITEKQWRLEGFPAQHDQESRTVSLFFYDPDLLSSYDEALVTSSSRKPSREVGMLRKHENMSIPGNVFDRQHAQRDSDELHNDPRNLATSTEGIEHSGSEEPLQSIPLLCFSVRARRKI